MLETDKQILRRVSAIISIVFSKVDKECLFLKTPLPLWLSARLCDSHSSDHSDRAHQLARFLSEHHSGELHVLDHYSFYHPGWEKEAARMLFEPLPPGAKVLVLWGVVWGSHAHQSERGTKSTNFE